MSSVSSGSSLRAFRVALGYRAFLDPHDGVAILTVMAAIGDWSRILRRLHHHRGPSIESAAGGATDSCRSWPCRSHRPCRCHRASGDGMLVISVTTGRNEDCEQAGKGNDRIGRNLWVGFGVREDSPVRKRIQSGSVRGHRYASSHLDPTSSHRAP